MTAPAEIESFVGGFDLTAANYSGGAGGDFANLISGRDAWTVDGATPSFSTVNGLSGMDFTASSTESIIGPMPALYEATVVMIAKPGSTGSMYLFGGNWSGGNSFGVQTASNLLQAFHSTGASGFTTSFTGTQANVFTCSWSPFNGTAYAQVNTGTIKSTVQASKELVAVNFPEVAIGRHRTTYFSGWIGRVLIFSRALHFRDNAVLQSLITTEMAKVGL